MPSRNQAGGNDLANISEEGASANQSGALGSSRQRRGFAGNAAFQSAIQRKANDPSDSSSAQGRTNHGHARRISLQRGNPIPEQSAAQYGDDAYSAVDDGASVASFNTDAAFDPTRRGAVPDQGTLPGAYGHPQQGRSSHFRSGSDFPNIHGRQPPQNIGTGPNNHGLHGRTASMGQAPPAALFGGGFVSPHQAALQQQIDFLQLQQQQLAIQQQQQQQAAMYAPMPSPGDRRGPAHRRAQSYAPQGMSAQPFMGLAGMPPLSQQGYVSMASPLSPQPPTPSRGNGHTRRHSVNVTNRQNRGAPAPTVAPVDLAAANGDPNGTLPPAGGLGPAAPFPASGPFSQASAQLQALSPEYLMAGGGLLNIANLGTGGMNDLADGFSGTGNDARRGHARSGSLRINGGPGANVVDLAQAQAQLASLHQSRAQISGGGGGHGRMMSYAGGFDPNLGGMGSPGGPPQRKALFGSYLPQSSLPPLLAAGKLVVGVLRVNKRNRSDAYVTTEVLDSDIFISGSKDRNRALEGDVVAVELLDPNEVWQVKKEKEDKKKRKEEQGVTTRRADNKAHDDAEVEGAQLKLIEDEEDNDSAPPALAGHVVAIVERSPGQLFSGTLGLLRPSSAATKEKQQAERQARGQIDTSLAHPTSRPRIVWFRPTDKRVPLIAIPADQAPADFWKEGGQEVYASRLFVACIKRWPITSLHPFGALVEEVGAIGNVEAETQALLKDSISTATEEFSESALKCLPPLPWSVPPRELESRRDFRDQRVFSIDPPTAKDLDDALSIRKLEDNLFEVGVHIADVSYFVKLGSALDRDARKRGTSIYLVQRAIPMLPPTLCEELCSLVPNVERLAFSAVFKMTEEGNVVDTWFGRTVIKSCAQLAYSDAQEVIEGRKLPTGKLSDSDLAPLLEEDIRVLHKLAAQMRQRRFDDGALRIDNVKLSFTLDDTGLPTDAKSYKTYQAHQLIEEFMLLANISVAGKIAAGQPEVALLRRHERPMVRRLEGFKERARKLGYEIDTSTSGKMYASLRKVSNVQHRQALEALASRAMLRAKYFCTGMVDIAKYGHYALNVPLYTHFTSPIRRYADLMVHRQLDAILQSQDKFPVDREAMAKIAQQCNVKRDAAKLAQEQSAHLFLCLLIHDLTMRYGPVIRNATVIGVLDAAFDVLIQEFGVEKRVHVDQIPIEHHSHDEASNTLTLYWKKGVDVISWLAENSGDAHVQRLREVAAQHAMMEMTSQSHTDEEALFEDDPTEAPSAALAAIVSGEDAKGSEQRLRSFKKEPLAFKGVSVTRDGHHVQEINELLTLPILITSDLTHSPPVLKIFACNPFT